MRECHTIFLTYCNVSMTCLNFIENSICYQLWSYENGRWVITCILYNFVGCHRAMRIANELSHVSCIFNTVNLWLIRCCQQLCNVSAFWLNIFDKKCFESWNDKQRMWTLIILKALLHVIFWCDGKTCVGEEKKMFTSQRNNSILHETQFLRGNFWLQPSLKIIKYNY